MVIDPDLPLTTLIGILVRKRNILTCTQIKIIRAKD
jgi:hypothetical protein